MGWNGNVRRIIILARGELRFELNETGSLKSAADEDYNNELAQIAESQTKFLSLPPETVRAAEWRSNEAAKTNLHR